MKNNINDTVFLMTQLFASFKNLFLGLFGGAINYFYYIVSKRREEVKVLFSTAQLVMNMLIGAFVGYTISRFIPPDLFGHDGIIALSGAMSLKILELSESKFAEIMVTFFTKRK